MSQLIDRILMAYRPLYLRGLLMDGQYRLPATPEKTAPEKGPEKGNRVVHSRQRSSRNASACWSHPPRPAQHSAAHPSMIHRTA